MPTTTQRIIDTLVIATIAAQLAAKIYLTFH